MKLKLAIAFLATALLIATNVALAHHTNKGKHHGWDRPGHPHNYASPRHQEHP